MELAYLSVPLAVFLAVFVLIAAFSTAGDKRRLLGQRLEVTAGSKAEDARQVKSGILRDQRLSSIEGLDRALRRASFAEGMALDLARAGLPLRVGEYLLLRAGCGLGLALVGHLGGLPPFALLLLAPAGFYLPKLYVRLRQRGRWSKLNDQLVDFTSMVANSLKAGSSFIQGLELASREMPSPISDEIRQVLAEMSVGSPTEETLQSMTRRVPSYDLELIVTAMLIQRQVGGNLAEILGNISGTIRARIRMLREVRALTAEARISAYVVGLLPFFLMGIISFVNKGYMMSLLSDGTGRLILVAAIVMEIVGFVLLRRMTAIEV